MSFSALLMPKFSSRLQKHITDVDLDVLSRVPATRLAEKALPHIGLIELVSAEDFSSLYDALYVSMFPHEPERERSDLIVRRLHDEFANARNGLAPYRIVGIRDKKGSAIGAAQFSVLMLKGAEDEELAVPYLQYIYVRQENRRQDMAEILHTLVLAVTTEDGRRRGIGRVPFTLFETEPSSHGLTEAARLNATKRAIIHTKAGAIAIMLRRKSDTTLVTPHVQPGLEVSDPPISLVWAIRPSPAQHLQSADTIDINRIGRTLIDAYYQSLKDEGFPERNIYLAKGIVVERCVDSEFLTMPLCDVVVH